MAKIKTLFCGVVLKKSEFKTKAGDVKYTLSLFDYNYNTFLNLNVPFDVFDFYTEGDDFKDTLTFVTFVKNGVEQHFYSYEV